MRGSKKQTYTAGVVCAKVARYAERIHHPERVTFPMRRIGPKGSGQFARITWDEALDEIAERFNQAEREFGAESIWPYYYAGTMGIVMRDGLNRLTHVKKYSRFYQTICANVARIGYAIGTGKIAGVDPREMALSDLVVIWGTNPVNTQVNVMTHAARARKERGAMLLPSGLRRLYIARDADAAGDAVQATLTQRAQEAGIEAIALSPRLGDFNEDLHIFGIEPLRAALRLQLVPEDVVRFLHSSTVAAE